MLASLTFLRTRGLLLAGLLCWQAHHCSALAAESAIVEFRHRSWTRDQGLPSDEIRALLQTRDGYLWIGTRTGLARFDGLKFTVFNRSNTPEMVSDTVTALAEDRDGKVWVGTSAGLLCRQGQMFQRHGKETGLPWEGGVILCAGSDGRLWVGSSAGLFSRQGDRWSHWGNEEGLVPPDVSAVCEDPGKGLWIGSLGSIFYLDLDSRKLTKSPYPPRAADSSALGLRRTLDGSLLAVLQEGELPKHGNRLYRFQEGQWFRYAEPEIYNRRRPPCLSSDSRSGMVLSSTRELLYRFHHETFTPVPLPPLLHDPVPLCALEDREGNLWIGTENSGLHQLQPNKLLALSSKDGLAHDNARTILETRDGAVWIGTEGGLSRVHAGHVTSYTEKEGLARKDVRALAEDHEGRLWIGMGFGLDCLENGRFIHHRFPGEWFETKIRALHAGSDGALWVGALKGLHRLYQGERTTWTGTNGLVNDDARAVFEDRTGTVWIGTDGAGLLRLRSGQIDRFTISHGLASEHVFGFYEDADCVLWFGSERGLHRLQNGRFFVFARRQGLFDDVIKHVLEDDFGHLWLSGDRGIARVSKTELNDVAAGHAQTISCVVYGEEDGMLSGEINGQLSQPAGCKTRDGRLWFPTTRGVVIIDPRELQAAELPPPVVIEQLRADDEAVFGDGANSSITRAAGTLSHPTGEGRGKGGQTSMLNPQSRIRLSPGRGRVLEFQYTANTFVAPGKARFKHRLDGYDKEWHDAGTRRVAYYTNLRPGDYQFRVLAANHHNVWNETGAALGFYLAPFFYQTWTFRIGSILALALAILATVGWRIGEVRRIERLEKDNALVRALAGERARMATDLHDGLGSSLTRINLLAELVERELSKPEVVRPRLRELFQSTREVIAILRGIIWAAHPADATLDGVIAQICRHAEDFLGAAGIRTRFDAPSETPLHPTTAEQRHHLFFVTREALNNIVNHASASEVLINFSAQDSTFKMTIDDNGHGFEIQNPKSEMQNGQTGQGLRNMQNRIAALAGKFKINSEPGKGTRIEIEVPLNPRRNE